MYQLSWSRQYKYISLATIKERIQMWLCAIKLRRNISSFLCVCIFVLFQCLAVSPSFFVYMCIVQCMYRYIFLLCVCVLVDSFMHCLNMSPSLTWCNGLPAIALFEDEFGDHTVVGWECGFLLRTQDLNLLHDPNFQAIGSEKLAQGFHTNDFSGRGAPPLTMLSNILLSPETCL